MPKLPTHRLDTDGLPPGERLDGWRKVVVGYDISLPPETAREAFAAAAEVWNLGAMTLTDAKITLIRMGRSEAQAQADGNDSQGFLFLEEGAWDGLAGPRQAGMRAGQLVGVDNRQSSDMTGHTEKGLTLTIARTLFNIVTPRLPDLHGVPLVDAAAGLLSDHLASLRRHIDMIDERDMPDVEQATLRLLGAALGHVSRNIAAEEAAQDLRVFERVKRFIDDNLTMKDLGPDRICQEFGYSRAALYRAFKPGFGIAGYIRQERLRAAHRVLIDPRNTDKIADIADRFGFVSDAHFSRLFREAYSLSPREARARKGHLHPPARDED